MTYLYGIDPKSIAMKLLYTLLFAVFTLSISAQEISVSQTAEMTEIPGFKLYPNPTFDDVIYITTQQNAPKEITIYDIFGKVVLRNRITNTELDISHLDSGVYVLQVVENKKSISRKLVIK